MNRVTVTLNNQSASLTDIDDETLEALDDYWSYSMPGAYFSPAYRQGVWDGRIRYLKRRAVPAGLFRATVSEAEEKLGINFKIIVSHPKIELLPGLPASEDEQYRYQDTCVTSMCGAISSGGGIVLASTGTGKTATCAKFMSKVPYHCLFVVDQVNLLDQAQKEIHSWLGEEIGIVGRSVFDPKRITIATIQTLKRHHDSAKFEKWFSKIQIVVVDEIHEMLAKKNFGILNEISPIARFGLTATLQLQKKEVRYKAWAMTGPVIYEFPMAEGIKRGVLTKGFVLQLLFAPIPFTSTDPFEIYRQQVVENKVKLYAWKVLSEYLLDEGRCIITLTSRLEHLYDLSEATDYPHRIACGAVDRLERKRHQRRFERGKINHIIANQVLKKGVSISRVDAMFDLAELKSKNDTVQKFGRGVRLCDDKTELVYIDFGTQGPGNNLSKAALSRCKALRKCDISVTRVKVKNYKQALAALKDFLVTICKNDTKQKKLPDC